MGHAPNDALPLSVVVEYLMVRVCSGIGSDLRRKTAPTLHEAVIGC